MPHALEYYRKYCDECGEVRTHNRHGCLICAARNTDPGFKAMIERVQDDLVARKIETIRENDSFCALDPEE